MAPWTGIVLARAAPGGDGMKSRLSTYLHPLAGRPLLWHAVSSLANAHPPAERLILAGDPDLRADLLSEFGQRVELARSDSVDGADLQLGTGAVLIVDAAAPALGRHLPSLLACPPGTYLEAPDGRVAAALLGADQAESLVAGEGLLDEVRGLRGAAAAGGPEPECVVVHDRSSLARAGRVIHDAIVARLMAGGATFLLPDSVLIDVDVQIGHDTVVYPGVVLEGHTVVGEETVIGPGCRIIDSWIGSGVELKGWNFISRASVRNRAILEPYVRRGFD